MLSKPKLSTQEPAILNKGIFVINVVNKETLEVSTYNSGSADYLINKLSNYKINHYHDKHIKVDFTVELKEENILSLTGTPDAILKALGKLSIINDAMVTELRQDFKENPAHPETPENPENPDAHEIPASSAKISKIS